jgi:hypothetical protein
MPRLQRASELVTHLAQYETSERELNEILGILAWLVTAAGVAGVLLVGTRMALSQRRGEGEEHFRQLSVVLGACIVAAAAPALVAFALPGFTL